MDLLLFEFSRAHQYINLFGVTMAEATQTKNNPGVFSQLFAKIFQHGAPRESNRPSDLGVYHELRIFVPSNSELARSGFEVRPLGTAQSPQGIEEFSFPRRFKKAIKAGFIPSNQDHRGPTIIEKLSEAEEARRAEIDMLTETHKMLSYEMARLSKQEYFTKATRSSELLNRLGGAAQVIQEELTLLEGDGKQTFVVIDPVRIDPITHLGTGNTAYTKLILPPKGYQTDDNEARKARILEALSFNDEDYQRELSAVAEKAFEQARERFVRAQKANNLELEERQERSNAHAENSIKRFLNYIMGGVSEEQAAKMNPYLILAKNPAKIAELNRKMRKKELKAASAWDRASNVNHIELRYRRFDAQLEREHNLNIGTTISAILSQARRMIMGESIDQLNVPLNPQTLSTTNTQGGLSITPLLSMPGTNIPSNEAVPAGTTHQDSESLSKLAGLGGSAVALIGVLGHAIMDLVHRDYEPGLTNGSEVQAAPFPVATTPPVLRIVKREEPKSNRGVENEIAGRAGNYSAPMTPFGLSRARPFGIKAYT